MRNTSSTGGCSRRWVTRNRSGTRAPRRTPACAGSCSSPRTRPISCGPAIVSMRAPASSVAQSTCRGWSPRFRERIAEPDRTWLAVAAYNVGYGHLEDARILAQQAGRNADQWQDVREFLPLLSQERWYTRTRRGYARGWEPVRYVENVQSYLNILEVAGIGAPAIASASGADPEQPAARATR